MEDGRRSYLPEMMSTFIGLAAGVKRRQEGENGPRERLPMIIYGDKAHTFVLLKLFNSVYLHLVQNVRISYIEHCLVTCARMASLIVRYQITMTARLGFYLKYARAL